MRKIEVPKSLNSSRENKISTETDGVPADMWNTVAWSWLYPTNSSRDPTKPLSLSKLLARSHHQMHAKTNAEDWNSATKDCFSQRIS